MAKSSPSSSVRRGARRLALAPAIVVACGCGPSRPPLGKVQGQVLYHDKPLAGATVGFMSSDASHYSFGKTDEQGTFHLTTYEPDDGAIVGFNTITVTLPNATANGPPTGVQDPAPYFRDLNAPKDPALPTIPARYADAATSGLTFTVERGENAPTFKLVD